MENKFYIGKKVLTDNEIEQHKDFASLYRSYQTAKKPIFKTTRFITGISVAAAAIVVFVLYFSFYRINNPSNPVDTQQQGLIAVNSKLLPRKVTPPIAGMEVPHQTFKINSTKGGTIKTENGTEISVPAKAFVDQNGKEISGDVEITYREFNNPVDFFLSGIPMHQVTDDQMTLTESAGMFEILAFQHEQSLKLNKDKNIGVELVSFFPGNLDCFYLNSNEQQWQNCGKNQLVAQNGEVIPATPTQEYKADSSGFPVMPRKASKKKAVFNIKVDVSDFPELSEYKGLLFEVNETYKKFDERLYDNTWDKATLTASTVPGNYDLTLSIRDTSVTITVYPVFNSKNYDEAMRIYQEKKLEWLALQKENQENMANRQGRNEKDHRNNLREPVETEVLAFNKMKPLGKRHFDVNILGIYQCGKKLDNKGMKNIRPKITDMGGNEIHNAVMYLSERNHNTLSCFGNSDVISFRDGSKSLFWVVTPDGKIGVLSPESFAALTRGNDTPGFKMVFVEPAIGVAILKDALKI